MYVIVFWGLSVFHQILKLLVNLEAGGVTAELHDDLTYYLTGMLSKPIHGERLS